jgi:hypothetical protein
LLFAVVLLADFCVPVFAGFLSAIAKPLLRTAQRCSWMRIRLRAGSRTQSRTPYLLGRVHGGHARCLTLRLRPLFSVT